MSTINNIESLTPNELAALIMGDCVNDPAFRADVKSKTTGKPLAKRYPKLAIGQ